MKETVFQDKMAVLKRKKEQVIKLIDKEEEKLMKYRENLETIESQILQLNHKHSGLSAEELAEALALYKQQKLKAEAKKEVENSFENTANSTLHTEVRINEN